MPIFCHAFLFLVYGISYLLLERTCFLFGSNTPLDYFTLNRYTMTEDLFMELLLV